MNQIKRCHILQTIHGALHQEAARLHILLANGLQLLNPLSQLHNLLLQLHNRLFQHRRQLKLFPLQFLLLKLDHQFSIRTFLHNKMKIRKSSVSLNVFYAAPSLHLFSSPSLLFSGLEAVLVDLVGHPDYTTWRQALLIKAQSTVSHLEFAMETSNIMLLLLELFNLITTLLLTTRKHHAQISSIQLLTASHSNFSRSLPTNILTTSFSELLMETIMVVMAVRVIWM